MDGANACLEDFLFFCNSEVDLALKIGMLRKIDGQCYFVSFPDLKSALPVVWEENDGAAIPLTCVNKTTVACLEVLHLLYYDIALTIFCCHTPFTCTVSAELRYHIWQFLFWCKQCAFLSICS